MLNKIGIVFILAAGLVQSACGGSDTPSAEPATVAPTAPAATTSAPANVPEPTIASGASANSEAPIPLVERLLPDPDSRAFRYAGAEFVIREASISNRDLMNRERTMPGNPWVNVAIQATNNQDYPVTTPKFELAFTDGTSAGGLDGIRLNKNESTELNLRGVVKADTAWDGAVLTLAASDREPLELALTGALEKSEYPHPLKSGDAVTATTKYGEKIRVGVTDAILDIDGIVSGQRAERAPLGKRFVRVNLEAQNMDAKNGMSVAADSFQLTADGAPAELAFDETGAKTVPLQETANFTFYFLVPAESRAFKLVVTPDGQAPGDIALTP